MGLKTFFEPKSVAIIGASRHPRKLGNVILRNFIELKYDGKLFVVNPNAEEVHGHKTYDSIKDIQEQIELAIITTPAEKVPAILEECAAKKIKESIVISAGFADAGNTKIQEQIEEIIKKKKLNVLGPNCLGVYDAHSKIDTLFFPREKLDRPDKGGISFVCQSGSVGAIMLDKMAQENCGLRRFISFGQAGLDESDFIDLLGKDDKTKVICVYLENLRDGRKFLDTCKRVSKKKPIISIKTGMQDEETEQVYKGVFKQAKVMQADSLEGLFDYARILEKGRQAKGNKIQIISNGDGQKAILEGELRSAGLKFAELSKQSSENLHRTMPSYVNVTNPLNIIGDANDDRFKLAIETAFEDKGVDVLIVTLMPQSPTITINIIKILRSLYEKTEKPMYLVVPGGSFADTIKREFELHIPSFSSTSSAINAIKAVDNYYSTYHFEKQKIKRTKHK